jgi:type IV secretion system protein VirB10
MSEDLNRDSDHRSGAMEPLPGEPGIPDVARPQRAKLSKRGLLAVALLLVLLLIAAGVSIHRLAARADNGEKKRIGDQPTAATAEPRRLELPAARAASAAAAVPVVPRIPALVPTADELAEPIGVRRTGQPAPASAGAKAVAPEDAPVLLVSSRPRPIATTTAQRPEPRADERTSDQTAPQTDSLQETKRNLEAYQRQLQSLLETLTRSATAATGGSPGAPAGLPSPALPSLAGPAPPATNGLFGGQMQGSTTPRTPATTLANRSLTLPKGTAFTCALKTKVISAASGFVGCQVQRNVYSDDGRVLLIERGSHIDGEYRIASVRPGMVRIPVLWTRIRTPDGVILDIDSPATGQLGEAGIDGHVDNRWPERIGAALLLSLIDDAVKLSIQNQAADRDADTIVLPSTTAGTSKLAEKVLDSTINIPPLIYRNQGGIVGIYVARDVDFSSVYELQPAAQEAAR